MRYDQILSFIKTFPGEYDEATGNYGDDTTTTEKLLASVSSLSLEQQITYLGEHKKGALIAHTKSRPSFVPDHVEFKGNKYKSLKSRNLRGGKTVFVLGEVS